MTYCSVVAAIVLIGLTKKRFGHYAISKLPPSDHQAERSNLIAAQQLPIHGVPQNLAYPLAYPIGLPSIR